MHICPLRPPRPWALGLAGSVRGTCNSSPACLLDQHEQIIKRDEKLPRITVHAHAQGTYRLQNFSQGHPPRCSECLDQLTSLIAAFACERPCLCIPPLSVGPFTGGLLPPDFTSMNPIPYRTVSIQVLLNDTTFTTGPVLVTERAGQGAVVCCLQSQAPNFSVQPHNSFTSHHFCPHSRDVTDDRDPT